VAVLSNPQNPSNPLQVEHLRQVAPKRGLRLLSFETRTPEDIEQAFLRMAKQADALLVIGDPMLQSHQKRVIELATKARLPAIYTDAHAVEDGGMMSYTVNFAELYRRAAVYIDKILKGAKPDELPMEQPRKFELVVNLVAAKQIGVTVPRALLQRADRVLP
jgi:putative ABC transport system substrate-binding protein